MIAIYFLNHVLEAILFYFYTFSIHSHRFSKKTDFLLVFSSYCVIFGLFLRENILLNFSTNLAVPFLFYCFVLRLSVLESLFHASLTTIMIIISELIYDIPTVLFHSDTTFEYPTLASILCATVIINLIHFIMVLILINWQKKHPFGEYALTAKIMITVFLLISMISTEAIQTLGFTLVIDSSNIPWVYVVLFCILALAIGVIISVILLQTSEKRLLEANSKMQQMETDRNYNTLIRQLNDDQRILIHDIKRHLTVMQDNLKNENYGDLERHIVELSSSNALSGGSVLTKNKTLSLVLSRYLAICKESGISFSLDVKRENLSFLSPYEVTSLFCNLLDNAVEACEKMDHPVISLQIGHSESNHNEVIVLSNSCDKTPIYDTEGFLSTGKNDLNRHGYGTRSIRRIVNNYNGHIEHVFISEHSVFQTIIIIPEVTSHETSDL